MQKSECGFGGGFKRVPVGAHGFKQAKRADDIGLNKFLGAVNGSIHVGLGGKVNDGANGMASEQFADQFAVGNIAVHKSVRGVRGKRVEIVGVAGVGERVKINHGFIAVGEPILNEITADEARAAGDKYGHGCEGSRGGRPLVTRNVRDFDNLPGVVVLGY